MAISEASENVCQTSAVQREPFRATPASATLAYTLAGVCVVTLLAVSMMFALEGDDTPHHIFGPISDIGGVPSNLLLLPLIAGFGVAALPVRGARWILVGTMAVTVLSSIGSTLLVVDVLPFPVATAVTLAAAWVQFGWLYAISWTARGRPGWSRLSRLGRLIGVGTYAGALLFGLSLVFGRGTPTQIVIQVTGIILAGFGWLAWPVWMFLLGRRLSSLPQFTHQRSAS